MEGLGVARETEVRRPSPLPAGPPVGVGQNTGLRSRWGIFTVVRKARFLQRVLLASALLVGQGQTVVMFHGLKGPGGPQVGVQTIQRVLTPRRLVLGDGRPHVLPAALAGRVAPRPVRGPGRHLVPHHVADDGPVPPGARVVLARPPAVPGRVGHEPGARLVEPRRPRLGRRDV